MDPPAGPVPFEHALSEAIRQAQSSFVRGVDPQRLYDDLLRSLVRWTASEYGFLCEAFPGGSGSPRFRVVGWSHREPQGAHGGRVMRELLQGLLLKPDNVLLPEAPVEGQLRVAAWPPGDASAPRPFAEAAPIETFAGLPLHYGGEWVGVIGLANRRPGFDAAQFAALDPLLRAMAGIVAAFQRDHRRETMQHRMAGVDHRLRDLLEALDAGLAVIGTEGRFQEVSNRMCEIVGRTRAELLKLRVDDITHPDDLPRNPAVFRRMVDGSLGRHTFEKRYLRPDGTSLWVQISSTVVRDERGAFDRAVAIVLDIDERKRAQAELQARESQFVKLASKVPGVLLQFHIDVAGHATVPYANPAMRELFELDPEGPVRQEARLMIERVVKGQRGKVWSTLEACSKSLRPWSLEWEIELPERGRRWVHGRGTPERLPDGSTLYHGYIDDITERKRYEEAVVAAEASTRANAAKTEFLSRMSHELRTPLNAVLGFAQLLASDPHAALDDNQRTRVAHIEHAGQHLLAMIGDVLDLSRIEGGSLPLDIAPVPVRKLIEDSFALVAPTARAAGVRLEIRSADAGLVVSGGSPQGLHVRADPMRLRQVMVNLLSNAIKYNRAGGQVTVGIDTALDRVCLSVADTGFGLTPAQQTHLFEPFNRLGAERGSVEGTGLGLAITLRLVELMAGSITVHSETDRGSTFVVDLPRAEVAGEEAPAANAPRAPPMPADATPGPAPIQVLYAEDNELNVELVRQLMTLRPGCELRIARNGREAIDMACAAPPHLLLIDMHLGDMGGLDVLEALRGEVALRGVPRIALSADALPQSIAAARAAGFDEYLTKPVDVARLLAVLDGHRAPLA